MSEFYRLEILCVVSVIGFFLAVGIFLLMVLIDVVNRRGAKKNANDDEELLTELQHRNALLEEQNRIHRISASCSVDMKRLMTEQFQWFKKQSQKKEGDDE